MKCAQEGRGKKPPRVVNGQFVIIAPYESFNFQGKGLSVLLPLK